MNHLAETAETEALKRYHGAEMGAKSNLDEILAPFPRWNRKEAESLWCAAFVLFCCRKADLVVPARPEECVTCNLAGCGAWEEWALADDRITYFAAQEDRNEPMPGDIVLYDRVFCDAAHDHIGIVINVSPDALIVAEGNYHSISCLVTRSRDEHTRAFIRIPDGFVYG